MSWMGWNHLKPCILVYPPSAWLDLWHTWLTLLAGRSSGSKGKGDMFNRLNLDFACRPLRLQHQSKSFWFNFQAASFPATSNVSHFECLSTAPSPSHRFTEPSATLDCRDDPCDPMDFHRCGRLVGAVLTSSWPILPWGRHRWGQVAGVGWTAAALTGLGGCPGGQTAEPHLSISGRGSKRSKRSKQGARFPGSCEAPLGGKAGPGVFDTARNRRQDPYPQDSKDPEDPQLRTGQRSHWKPRSQDLQGS